MGLVWATPTLNLPGECAGILTRAELGNGAMTQPGDILPLQAYPSVLHTDRYKQPFHIPASWTSPGRQQQAC